MSGEVAQEPPPLLTESALSGAKSSSDASPADAFASGLRGQTLWVLLLSLPACGKLSSCQGSAAQTTPGPGTTL